MLYIILAIIVFAVLYTYKTAFYSPKGKRDLDHAPLKGDQYTAVSHHIHRMTDAMKQYPFEEISIQSFDGIPLFGRYYHLRDGAPVEVLFHGYRSSPFRDCSGGHALSRKLGINALIVDQRAHGKSGGGNICFGVKERQDCLAWTNYICARFGDKTQIILSGLSMGAATVLMSANLPLPQNVKCIIADSPYSSPKAIIEKVCIDKKLPLFLCRPLIHFTARILAGFSLDSCNAKDSVKHSDIPILLIHGEADYFVPCSMSHEIAAENQNVQLFTFPNAGHGLCYLSDPLRYEKIIYAFLCAIPSLNEQIYHNIV